MNRQKVLRVFLTMAGLFLLLVIGCLVAKYLVSHGEFPELQPKAFYEQLA